MPLRARGKDSSSFSGAGPGDVMHPQPSVPSERSAACRPHRAGCVWFGLHSLCQRSAYSLSEWPFKLELKGSLLDNALLAKVLRGLSLLFFTVVALVWTAIKSTYPNNTRDISLFASSKGLENQKPGREFAGC